MLITSYEKAHYPKNDANWHGLDPDWPASWRFDFLKLGQPCHVQAAEVVLDTGYAGSLLSLLTQLQTASFSPSA